MNYVNKNIIYAHTDHSIEIIIVDCKIRKLSQFLFSPFYRHVIMEMVII